MFKLRPYQQACVDDIKRYIESKEKAPGIVVGPTGCHGKDSLIPLFDATFKKVQDIEVGDKLIGDDGTPRTVLQLVRGTDDLYEITPLKGHSFIVNGGHILSLYRTPDGKCPKTSMPGIDEISVKDYMSASKNFKNNHKLRKARGAFFEGGETLPLPPYFLGLYLGDGSSITTVQITTRWPEVVEYLYDMVKDYDAFIKVKIKDKGENIAKDYVITTGRGPGLKRDRNEIRQILKRLGLKEKTAGEKFIPIEYLRASWDDRMQLLAGFVDTDSYYDPTRNNLEYCSKSYTMIKQVQFLCRSLGFGAEIGKTKVVNGQDYYRMCINGDLDLIPNRVSVRQCLPRFQKKRHYVMCFDMKYIGKGEYYGFVLDGNHLYCDDQFFVHHNCGKSILIAEAARLLGDKTLVLQPSKELLEQNIGKLRSLGGEATIYSASCKSKELSTMTYATLGSVKKVVRELREMGIRSLLIDETHAGYSPDPGSEFMRFIEELRPRKVIGFTATPCRLKSTSVGKQSVSQLNFLTRMRPGYFKKVIHVTQVSEMIREGFWTPLKYETWRFDGSRLTVNSNGSEYTEESIAEAIEANGTNNLILKRLMAMDDRRSILVFMDSVESCRIASDWLNRKMGPVSAAVHGGLGKKERERIVNGFKDGSIRIVFNHSVLLTGFDHPGLDCVIFGRPTFSFPVWYQGLGRCIRIKEGKTDALVVDACDNMSRFGDVRELEISDIPGWGWGMSAGERIITNLPMEEFVTKGTIDGYKARMRLPECDRPMPGRPDTPLGTERMTFGMYKGYMLRALPRDYLSFIRKNMSLSPDSGVMRYINELGL